MGSAEFSPTGEFIFSVFSPRAMGTISTVLPKFSETNPTKVQPSKFVGLEENG